MSDIHSACREGNVDEVKQLIESGADLRGADECGFLPIHYACMFGHEEIARLLLQACVDVIDNLATTYLNPNPLSPLHWAVVGPEGHEGRESVVRTLLGFGAEVDIRDRAGRTPLLLACYRGYKEVVEVLLEFGAEVNILQTYEEMTPLHAAIANGHFELLRPLLHCGADPDLIDQRGNFPLYTICTRRNDPQSINSVIRMILEFGADVNKRNSDGFSSLHAAVRSSSLQSVVRTLLEFGADVNLYNYSGESPLLVACSEICEMGELTGIVRILLANGADVNLETPIEGETPLHRACARQRADLIPILLDYGADPEVYDRQGLTPLHLAAVHPYSAVIGMILKHGGDVNKVDHAGWTPLHHACSKGVVKNAVTLIRSGAEVNCVDFSGQTPLLTACLRADVYEELINFLLENGADVNISDINGRTPLHLVCYTLRDDLLDVLIEYGAQVNLRDRKGKTPLFISAEGGSADMVLSLINDHRADPNIPDKEGRTALRRVAARMDSALVDILLEGGARIQDARKFPPIDEELKQIKKESITDTDISFMDVFCMNPSAFRKPALIAADLKRDFLEKKFPIFGYTLFMRYKRGLRRKDLVSQCAEFFSLTDLVPLPLECSEEILHKLSEQDLRKLVKICDVKKVDYTVGT